MQNAAFRAFGLRAVYVALRCSADDVAPLMRSLARAGGGGNVTIPHKEAAALAVDRRLDEAAEVGACNVFWRERMPLAGSNTDVEGLLRAVEPLEPPPRRGSSSAPVEAPGRRGRRRPLRRASGGLLPLARRAAGFARWIAERGIGSAAPRECRLVINATPLGLRPDDPLPVDPDLTPQASVAFDMVYRTRETPWVRAMRAAGLPSGRWAGHARGSGCRGVAALVPGGRAPDRDHAGRRGCRASLSGWQAGGRWRSWSAGCSRPRVSCATHRWPDGRATHWSARSAAHAGVRWSGRSATAAVSRLRRPGMPDLRRLATGPYPRPERRVAGAVGAPSGAPPQVRGMVAGSRGDGGSDADAGAIDRAGILDTCSSRGPAGAGPGYNQSEQIARELGRRTGLPVRRDLLRRVRETRTQTALTPEARQANLAGAFGCDGRRGAGVRPGGRCLHHRRHVGGRSGGADGRRGRRVEAVTFARALEPVVAITQGDSMAIRVGINGFGRIGATRCAPRRSWG